MKKIKVLIAAEEFALVTAIRDCIASDARLQIVAITSSAYEARDKIIEYDPDVMILADNVARMSGLKFLKKLLPQKNVPTFFLGAPSLEDEALRSGACFFIPLLDEKNIGNNFFEINNLNQEIEKLVKDDEPEAEKTPSKNKIHVIAMGASTGGTEAMFNVVKDFEPDIPGIVMVQHMPKGFTSVYAERLQRECKISAKEAKTGDIVRPGLILLAPAGEKQMRLVKVGNDYQVECKPGERVSGHRPSVDALFESVARAAGSDAIGVLMTGMGRDGAEGLLKMKKAGAKTIGQDEETSVVYGMPRVAYELGAVTYQLPLDKIAEKVKSLAYRKG